MRLSTEQRDRILLLLGRREASRRGLDLHTMDRLAASEIIRHLEGHHHDPVVRVPPPFVARRGSRMGNEGPKPKTITRRGWDMRSDDTHPDHGTRSGYSAGCRCMECTDANSAWNRTYRTAKGRHQ